jgi:hypothetical protein
LWNQFRDKFGWAGTFFSVADAGDVWDDLCGEGGLAHGLDVSFDRVWHDHIKSDPEWIGITDELATHGNMCVEEAVAGVAARLASGEEN